MARTTVTLDVAALVQAAATSALGIIALLCVLLAFLGWSLFKGSGDRYKLIVFGLAFTGAALLAWSLLSEGQKQVEQKTDANTLNNVQDADNSTVAPAVAPTTTPSPTPASPLTPLATPTRTVASTPIPKPMTQSTSQTAACDTAFLSSDLLSRWRDVEANYQRRHDLIPNLVSTVQAAGVDIRAIVKHVETDRATLANVLSKFCVLPGSRVGLVHYDEMQRKLDRDLDILISSAANDDRLRENTNFIALQAQFEGVANRIEIARRDYNAAAIKFNATSTSGSVYTLQ